MSLDAFREKAGPAANLQTLARGINVVALDSQPRDVIDLHAKLFKRHGITTIRNFDALNDVSNLIDSGRSITAHGLNHEVCITVMALPPGCKGAHDPAFYAKTLDELLEAEIPFTSICYKDASGTCCPSTIYETIKAARKRLPVDTRLVFHTHDTAGSGVVCYQAAIEAGVDQIDLSMAPCSGGTCQPDVATMWHALRGSNYHLNVDIDKIMVAEEVFKDCMSDYFLPPEAKAVEPLIPWSPMPGGALTANTQIMRDNGIIDRYPEVIAAMGEVVRLGGFGTSVTPVSQFYFQQAFNNVMFGKWEKFAEGYGKMVLGYFGKTPVEPDPEVVLLASEKMGLQPTKESPLEMDEANPEKGVNAARLRLEDEGLPTTEENLFIVAACGAKGISFLKGEMKPNVRKIEKLTSETSPRISAGEPREVSVRLDNELFVVSIAEGKATVNDRSYKVSIEETYSQKEVESEQLDGAGTQVTAPMPGSVLELKKKVGDTVDEGEAILVLEAMKMEMTIPSPSSGVVAKLLVEKGDQVTAGETLALID